MIMRLLLVIIKSINGNCISNIHLLGEFPGKRNPMIFSKGKNEKGRGLYLPVGDEEEDSSLIGSSLRRRSVGAQVYTTRPYLTFIMILVGMFTGIICIGLYMLSASEYNFHESSNMTDKNNMPPLVLISIDGFKYDYLKRGNTPNLVKLAQNGIYGPMKPQFPTYTFPNHYTIVTGLYPESHGIVGNAFYDPKLKAYFSYMDHQNLKESKWWKAEPIWNTIQKFGLRSATMFWPGSESLIHGRRPTYFHKYNGSISLGARIDQVLTWLDLPLKKRPHFISLYISQIDDVGHEYGPDSEQINQSLREVDQSIGALFQGFNDRNLNPNVVILSDHGMVTLKRSSYSPDSDDDAGKTGQSIFLDDFVSKHLLQWVDYGPIASVIPRPGLEDKVYELLKAAELDNLPLKVYRKSELPAKFHYCKSLRIAPIVVIARKGWIIDFKGGDWAPRGVHGYDPDYPEMKALLILSGPAFNLKQGKSTRGGPLKGISNLDIYPLMMHLLSIPAMPNNGTLTLVEIIKN